MLYPLPRPYHAKLSLYENQVAIKFVKDSFQKNLAEQLTLLRVSAPLFVSASSGLNDHLNGVERPIAFSIPGLLEAEIVQSLAKWKRKALKDYDIHQGKGIYTDMNAIRPDESLDNLHSLYVDQWDWEKRIAPEERTIEYLFKTVEKIFLALKKTEEEVNKAYPCFKQKLPEKIVFLSSSSLEERYPNLSRKERERALVKEYGAAFLYGIGWPLKDGKSHDGRAPDYDDWNLNGDILVYDEVLDVALELSSMGIRVDADALKKQLKEKGLLEQKRTPYEESILDGGLPPSIGGGIGQSRLCLFYLEKAHIGEVQSSLWKEEEILEAKKQGIFLL